MRFISLCKRLSALVFYAAVGAVLGWTIPICGQQPTYKPVPSEPQKEASKPATSKEETRPSNAKADMTAANRKRAEELLNKCYQDGLNSEPEDKAESLSRIADSMRKINKERALFIFQQAFEATSEIQSTDQSPKKAQLQSSIATMMAPIDVEKALQCALKMDKVYPKGDQKLPYMNFRNDALGLIAAQMANKDPDRAFEVVQQQITEGNFEPNLLAPVATALRKSRPEKSEQIFLEAIRQFQKPTIDVFQIMGFVNLTARLFELNRTLTREAVDLIVQAVDELEKKQQDNTMSFTMDMQNDKGGKSSVNSIREFAAVQAVAMMRRLDPERAKALEEHYSQYRANISKNPNGIMPIGGDLDALMAGRGTVQEDVQTTTGGPGQVTTGRRVVTSNDGNTSTLPSGSDPAGPQGTGTQNTVVIMRVDGSGSGSPPKPVDTNRLAAQANAQMQVASAARLAQSDPQAALNMVGKIELPADRAKALARVAGVLAKTEPEKARGLLGEAYTAAEKVPDALDRATILGYIADGYSNMDRDRALAVYTEAFTVAEKAMEEEAKAPASTPFADRLPTEFRRSNQVYKQLLTGLSKLNIDEAILRSGQIGDKKIRLLMLISIADYILNDGQSSSSEVRIYLN